MKELSQLGINAYIAARYSRYPEMYEYAKLLEIIGIGCTSHWVLGDHDLRSNHMSYTDHWLRLFGEEDFNDVIRADIFITFTELPGAPGRQRGGRHVEFGIALTLGLPIIAIGPKENIFHFLPNVVTVDTWEDALVHIALAADVITKARERKNARSDHTGGSAGSGGISPQGRRSDVSDRTKG